MFCEDCLHQGALVSVLVTSRNWPVTGDRAVLQTHQRIGRVTQRGSAPTPVRGNGQHQLTAPEDVG